MYDVKSTRKQATERNISFGKSILATFGLMVAAALFVLSASIALADSLTVTSTANSGPGSLREAVGLANPNDTITFNSNLLDQTIVLTEQIVITKNLTIAGLQEDGEIIISSDNVTRAFEIEDGANVSISYVTIRDGKTSTNGGAIHNAGTLTLNNTSILSSTTSGDGGGVYNSGTLNVNDSTIRGNSANNGGGIRSEEFLSLKGSTLRSNEATANGLGDNPKRGNGGGIAANGPVVIEGSIFNGNTAVNGGGGVFLHGNPSARVTGSAIISNTAGIGGGAFVQQSTTRMQNVTISSNSADDGGGIATSAGLTLQSVTIANNEASNQGGGIIAYTGDDDPDVYAPGQGTTILSNTLVAGNSANTANDGLNLYGSGSPIQSSGYNLVGDYRATISNEQDTDTFGSDDATINIGSLTQSSTEEGGVPWVHELLSDSPAVDKGSCDGNTTDQRGYSRPQNESSILPASGGDNCDIGAFEVVLPVAVDDSAATTSGASVEIDVINNPDGQDYHPDSNRQIASTWLVGPTELTKGPIDLDHGSITVNADQTVTYTPFNASATGDDSFEYVVQDDRGWQSNEATVVIELEYPCTTSELITAIEVANDDTARDTIFVEASCDYELAEVYQYPAANYPGGDDGPELPDGYTAGQPSSHGSAGLPDIITPITIKTVDDNAVTLNRTGDPAFRIFNVVGDGDLRLFNLTLSDGEAPTDGDAASQGNGGAIYSTTALTLTGTVVQNNTASNNGGGIYHDGTILSLNRIHINYDHPDPDYNRRTEISGNTATSGAGGGIYVGSGEVAMTRSDINENTAGSSGGGIDHNGDAISISSRSNVNNNQTTADGSDGGGIANRGGALTINNNSTIEGNRTAANGDGGGIYDEGSELLTITDSNVRNNGYDSDSDSNTTTTQHGGGLYNSGGDVELANSSINENRATGDGGGIHNAGGELSLNQSDARENTADGNGGGIYNTGGLLTLSRWDTDITGNTAGGDGGGVYHSSGDDLLMENGGDIGDNTATGNGGGLFMSGAGNLSIANANVYRNAAANGGGVHKTGGDDSSITYTSIRYNTASADGGGLYLDGVTIEFDKTTVRQNYAATNGGGFFIDGGTVTLNTSTVSSNGVDPADDTNKTTQGGGFYQQSGTVYLNNSTVAHNEATAGATAGFHQVAGTTELFSAVLLENPPELNNDNDIETDNNCSGSFESGGYNLVGDTCTLNGGTKDKKLTAPHKRQLGPLADNGGRTRTHMLRANSVGINTGNCNTKADIPPSVAGKPETNQDQRDEPRPILPKDGSIPDEGADGCEIGSVEGLLFMVDTDSDLATTQDDKCVTSANNCSLRAAIEVANNYESKDSINFEILDSGAISYTIAIDSQLPEIEEPITIDATTQPRDEDVEVCANTPLDHDLSIMLDGTGTDNTVDGLRVLAGESNIRGLHITNFGGDGIELRESGDNNVRCNWLTNNGENGIRITANSENNRINYWWDQQGRNLMRGNNENGLLVVSGTRNRSYRNDIFGNTGLGIDLADDGYTPNDAGDDDEGANNLQNFPSITSYPSEIDGNGKPVWEQVEGVLNAQPNTNYRVEFFTNETCEDDGYGEGQSWRTSRDVRTNGSGTATFEFDFGEPITDYYADDNESDEPYVTLSATDNRGNTSEFSLCSLYNSSISGLAWLDADRDGLRDSGEELLEGITVELYQVFLDRDRLVETATTNADGEYSFQQIANGTFYVRFDPGIYRITDNKDQGDDDTVDSDADPDSGNTDAEVMPNGTDLTNVDAGFKFTGATTTGSNGSKNPDTTIDITENGTTDSYTIKLRSQPNKPVTLKVEYDDTQIESVSQDEYTFTTDSWETELEVRVKAKDDDLAEVPIHTSVLTNVLTSDDDDFDQSINVLAYITDNDSATVAANPTELDVYIGGNEETFNLSLTQPPSDDVTVSFDIDNDAENDPLLDISPVTFTPDNYDVAIPVEVEAGPDASGNSIRNVRFILSSSDPKYDTGGEVITTTRVLVNVIDTPVRISPLELSATEGVVSQDARYTIQLTQVPSSTVTVVIDPDNQVKVDKTEVKLTPDKLQETVTVQAVDDAVPEPQHIGRISHTASSGTGDSPFDGLELPEVEVTINDNDSPGVNLSTRFVSVAEEGPTRAEYRVSLTTKPASDVTVKVVPDKQVQTFPKEPLVFTPDTWDTEAVVTVEAIDDAVLEQNPHLGYVNHEVTSDDPDYDKEGVDTTLEIEVTIADNEVPNVQVEPTLVVVEEEGETTAEYNISLATNPDRDVTIEFLPDPTGQITITPATLTFKLADDDWKKAKSVTVQAVDDTAEEDIHYVTIEHEVTSGGDYDGVNIPDVEVKIYDNDTEGVYIEPTELIMVENAQEAETYRVKLTKQPAGDVVVIVHPNSKLSVNKRALTFTDDGKDWKTARTIKVLPVNDDTKQPGGQYTRNITHSIAITSSAYTDLNPDAIPIVDVTVFDDESAGVAIAPVTMDLEEGGVGKDYKVWLLRRPLEDVTVNFKSLDGQVKVNPDSWTFQASDWNTATNKLIRVTALDNDLADGNRTDTITHTTESADPSYAAGQFAIDPMVVSITDDESPNIIIEPEAINVAEGGAQVKYKVNLAATPNSDVVVSLKASVADQVVFRPRTITFTAQLTPTARFVTVEALDDGDMEGDHAITIDHTAKAAEADDPYNSVPKQTIDVNIKEAGLILDPTEGLQVSEAGNTTEYNVSINFKPTADVVVSLTTDGQTKVIPKTLTFQADGDGWKAPQTVRIEAVDDDDIEWKHTSIIRHSFSSDDPAYNDGGFPETLEVNVEDNDYPSVEIEPLEVAVTEGEQSDPPVADELTGTWEEYGVTLSYTPTGEVEVTIETDGQSLVVPPTLTWTPDDTDPNWWKAEKTVRVYSEYDKIAEGLHSSIITHKTSCATCTNPDEYNNLDDIYVEVAITDDDSAGVSITDAGALTVSEEGETEDTYNIVLTSKPVAEVTVTFAPDEQVKVIPPSITFDATNWDKVREVTVRAIDDDAGEAAQHIGTIKHTLSSDDGNYDDATREFAVDDVEVTVIDNEVAGVNITPTTVDVVEGGATAEYEVSLTVPPEGEVTINFDFKTGGLAKVIPPSLTFDATNWDTKKIVTVEALDNFIATGDVQETINHSTTSSDPRYDTDAFVIDKVQVNITDDDKAGVSVVPMAINVSEDGNKDTYKVRLTSQPTEEVIVQITTGGQTKAVPAKLIWTPDGTDEWWKADKIVTVEAIDDDIAEGTHKGTLRHTVSSFDPQYKPNMFVIDDVEATIQDNDSPGVTIDPTSVEVSEDGNTATYQVNLNSEPTAEVTVQVNIQDGQTTTKPPFLTFDNTNWDVKKTVTVYAVDDDIAEGLHNGKISHSVSSDDTNYQPDMFAIKGVNVSIQDNDAPGITINPTTVRVSEDGLVGEYEVKLNSEPAAEVVVTMQINDGQTETIPPSLTFDATNWNVARKVKVQAIDDAIAEALHSGTIKHTVASDDANYQPDMFAIDTVEVTIEDNDAPGVTIDPTSVKVSEDGDTATYSIKLNSEPTAEVVVTVLPNKQLTVKPPDKTFDNTNWDIAQEITVYAVDDDIAEGLHTGKMTHAVSSADENYQPDMFAIADVEAQIQDNDAPGVTIVVPDDFKATEDGDTASYGVKLNSKPTADVIVRMSNPDGQTELAPMALKFTTEDWDTERSVTVSAVDDNIVEGLHSGTIRHNVISDDPFYKDEMFAIDNANVEIKDNDSAGVRIVPTLVEVAEGGSTASYSVTLTSMPTGTVGLAVQPADNQTTVSLESGESIMQFDTTNWNTGYQVTVEAVDDLIFEETHYGFITHAITQSNDANYQPKLFWVDQVKAEIEDNDAPGVIVEPTRLNMSEGGETASYSVTLTTIPTRTVTISLTIDEQVEVSPGILTFEPPTDNTLPATQLVSVTVVDDEETEGNHSSTIKHVIDSEDPAYNGTRFDPDPVKVNIRDNDGAGFVVITPSDLAVIEGEAKYYELIFTAAPSYTVKITAKSTDPSRVVLSETQPATTALGLSQSVSDTYKFSVEPEDWAQPNQVPVAAINNTVYDGVITRTIEHTAESADPLFDNTDIPDTVVSIQDDESMSFIAYLPLISKGTTTEQGLDLVASLRIEPAQESYAATDQVEIVVTVTNEGQYEVDTPFWVDFYVNPSEPPTAPNTPWDVLSEYGVSWYVQTSIGAGESIELRSTTNDPFFVPANTNWTGTFPSGTTDLYVFADVWNKDVDTGEQDPNGAIPELSEENNQGYLQIPQVP